MTYVCDLVLHKLERLLEHHLLDLAVDSMRIDWICIGLNLDRGTGH